MIETLGLLIVSCCSETTRLDSAYIWNTPCHAGESNGGYDHDDEDNPVKQSALSYMLIDRSVIKVISSSNCCLAVFVGVCKTEA